MARLNEEAIEEITHLLTEVKDVVRLMKEFKIYIDSDCWSATVPVNNEYEDILSWSKNDFETLDVSDIKSFSIGGNIVTGSQHQYKGKTIIAPKQLAKIQGEIFREFLTSIVESISLKHFRLQIIDPYGLTDNCGWEHYICIETMIKPSALQTDKTTELIKQIKNEEDNIIELSGSPVYANPKNNFDEDSGLIPQGNFPYMVEFFSDLVIDEDTIYQGVFGLNSRYIKDAMKLITQVENRAKELADKYADKGVKVTVNGLNDGCEKGMAVYVWIPYQ